jgi:hypothetical protein
MQSDPIGLRSGSLSTYGYVGQIPLQYTDPSGLLFGFNAGESFGDSAAQYWANLQLQTGNPLYAIPGAFAALWSPCTSDQTFLSLLPIGPAGRGVAAATRLLPNAVKGQIGEVASTAYNWLKGSTYLGRQVPIQGFTTIADSQWQAVGGAIYYVESKFGASTLTSAQRVARDALGDLYKVERWGYDWVNSIGAGAGTAAGAGAAATSSCRCK